MRFSVPTRGSDDDSVVISDADYEKRYAELFRQLDLNKDGKVDISELRTALAARGLHQGGAEEVRQSNAHINIHKFSKTPTRFNRKHDNAANSGIEPVH